MHLSVDNRLLILSGLQGEHINSRHYDTIVISIVILLSVLQLYSLCHQPLGN